MQHACQTVDGSAAAWRWNGERGRPSVVHIEDPSEDAEGALPRMSRAPASGCRMYNTSSRPFFISGPFLYSKHPVVATLARQQERTPASAWGCGRRSFQLIGESAHVVGPAHLCFCAAARLAGSVVGTRPFLLPGPTYLLPEWTRRLVPSTQPRSLGQGTLARDRADTRALCSRSQGFEPRARGRG